MLILAKMIMELDSEEEHIFLEEKEQFILDIGTKDYNSQKEKYLIKIIN